MQVVKKSFQKGTRRLELALWLPAWERFAMAAAMVKMMSFSAAMAHKHHVVEVLLVLLV